MADTPDQGSLAELFARDPFSHTKEDIDRIIQYYQGSRVSHNLGGKAPSKTAAINLEELGMGPSKPVVTMADFKRSGK